MVRLTIVRTCLESYSYCSPHQPGECGTCICAKSRRRSKREGKILLFTDDDCVPMLDWLEVMLEPFKNGEIVGAKGICRSHQKSLASALCTDRVRGQNIG